MTRLATIFLLLGVSSPAWALSQGEHADLALDACMDARLPEAFCERVASEAYNVDRHEWDDMAAHAQPMPGQDLCVAADQAAARVLSLGKKIEFYTRAGTHRAENMARLLGGALHTLQDNCAHTGISNAQHAWHSLVDTCEGGHESPDEQPEAVACAKAETELALREFTATLRRTGIELSSLDGIPSTDRLFPTRDGVCEFLDGAAAWDGIDRRWNNDVVAPMLMASFASGLGGASVLSGSMCLEERARFEVSAGARDVSSGPPSCKRVDAFCIGAADIADEAPPWETEEDPPDELGGCSATGSGGSLLAGLMLLGVRRRRRA